VTHEAMIYGWNNSLIWLADKLAGLCSRKFVSFLMSEPGEHSGAWPNFKPARAAAAEGDLAEAIRFAKVELEKEPDNREGLLLLANLHADKGEPGKAIDYLGQVERNALATDQQKEFARSMTERLRKTT